MFSIESLSHYKTIIKLKFYIFAKYFYIYIMKKHYFLFTFALQSFLNIYNFIRTETFIIGDNIINI